MLTAINEPVSVEVQRRPDGSLRPLAFAWRGQLHRIVSWGRESAPQQGEGTRHCYLVQTTGLETWELCQDTKTAQWTLRRHWARRYRRLV
jgi:hypothetical protein